MAWLIFLTLAVLGIAQKPWLVNDQLDADGCERMQQYAEQLIEGMARLVQEMEERSQQQSWVVLGALLFTALKQWQFWALVELFVLIFGLYCWLRKRSCEMGSSSEHGSSTRKEDNNDNTDKDSDSDDSWDLGRVSGDSTQWPVPYMSDKCKMLEELVEKLLGACQGLSRNCLFNPQLQPAIGMGCLYEGWSAWEDNILYRLLMPLRSPPRHVFHPELGAKGEMPERKPSLCMEMECTCVRERLVGDVLCFLHHPEDELRRRQKPSLLCTFCSGSYLDVEKTIHWFQNSVKAAWEHPSQSRHCCLTVLPSHRSCKIKLTRASKSTLSIEFMLGLQMDNSDDSFLSLE